MFNRVETSLDKAIALVSFAKLPNTAALESALE
jgi:hypothetical protein